MVFFFHIQFSFFFQSMIEVQSSHLSSSSSRDALLKMKLVGYIFLLLLYRLLFASAICQIKAPTHPLVKVLIGILFLLSSFPHTQRGIPSQKPPDNESAFTFQLNPSGGICSYLISPSPRIKMKRVVILLIFCLWQSNLLKAQNPRHGHVSFSA